MTLKRKYDDLLLQNLQKRPFIQPANQEYQILLEFDLKRQKEKNLILEERLKNKELFIQQMKNFQEELTAAYEQCKNQLIVAQEKIQYLQNVQFREYTQQIADLRHMLISKNTLETKRQSLSKDQRNRFISLSSKVTKNKSDRQLIDKKGIIKSNVRTNINIATLREGTNSPLQQQILKEINKFSNFITHFLQMAQCYTRQVGSQEKLSKKLKKSWKWIKQVVKDWDGQKDILREYKKFKTELQKLLLNEKESDLSQLLQSIKIKLNNKD